MAMYSFVAPFHEAEFCGVPLCVFDKLGHATGGKRLLNTVIRVNTFLLREVSVTAVIQIRYVCWLVRGVKPRTTWAE
jgi:hypothetical protein